MIIEFLSFFNLEMEHLFNCRPVVSIRSQNSSLLKFSFGYNIWLNSCLKQFECRLRIMDTVCWQFFSHFTISNALSNGIPTPFRFREPILMTCLILSYFSIPSLLPLIIFVTFNSLVPLNMLLSPLRTTATSLTST